MGTDRLEWVGIIGMGMFGRGMGKNNLLIYSSAEHSFADPLRNTSCRSKPLQRAEAQGAERKILSKMKSFLNLQCKDARRKGRT
jgi:hypothetical protein